MADGNTYPAHSPLGASGAHRWMVCPGSVSLLLASPEIEDAESDFAKEGTLAHHVADVCLRKGLEPWELASQRLSPDSEDWMPGTGYTFPDGKEFFITTEMVNKVTDYLTILEAWHPKTARHQGNHWVEKNFKCPSIHEYFYGTSDFIFYDEAKRTLHVWDFKYGAGIVVEATGNPQLKYYAAGALEELGLWKDVDKVVIHVYQPRAFHFDGPHRSEEVDPDELDAWVFDELVPAMDDALVLRHTTFGEHCRFCPLRVAQCPSVLEALAELEGLMKMVTKKSEDDGEGVAYLTPAQLGRLMELEQLSRSVIKAAGKRAFELLNAGKEVPGLKLVNSRKNREYKDGAEDEAKKLFGKRCLTSPALKSPAQLDELPGGKEFTARWAFKPQGAVTVAVEGDARRRVNRDAKSLFKPVKKGSKSNV